jgi:hypothetical protein
LPKRNDFPQALFSAREISLKTKKQAKAGSKGRLQWQLLDALRVNFQFQQTLARLAVSSSAVRQFLPAETRCG